MIADSPFKRLLGIWKTTGTIKTSGDDLHMEGTDTYELILGGHYILHKARVQMGPERSETYEIIGLEADNSQASMHFFNADGEKGVMKARINGDEFTIEGTALRFTGSINLTNTSIYGKWLKHSDENAWTEFIDLRLEKR